MPFQIKRIYDAPDESDGYRILVDRLWPRGIKKERAKLDGWEKDLAPSTELRKWFGHMPENFEAFSNFYKDELKANPTAIEKAKGLLLKSKKEMVTLLYGARDPVVNHAVVLKEFLESL